MNGVLRGTYNGDRSAASIKEWALGLLPNHVATVNRQKQVRARSVFSSVRGSAVVDPVVCVVAQNEWGRRIPVLY